MIEVLRLKDLNAAELFLGFRIGAVGRRDFTVFPVQGHVCRWFPSGFFPISILANHAVLSTMPTKGMEMVPRAAWYLVEKAERAKLHLDAFNGHVSAYMKEPYGVITKHDANNRRYVKRFHLKAFESVLGMELGEFLYCLRSGLDQMAWQMALPNARRDSPRDIYFPITEDLSKGDRSSRDRRRSYAKALKRFPHDVRRQINAIQPHKGADPPETHPLWQLNKLCNLDKHKLIPIHSRGINPFIPAVPGVEVKNSDREDSIEVSVPEEYKNRLDLRPTLPDPIEIGEWNSDWRVPLYRLSDIHGFITCTVIPRFVPFNLADIPTEPLRVYKVTPIY
jgi:hypothetical protein